MPPTSPHSGTPARAALDAARYVWEQFARLIQEGGRLLYQRFARPELPPPSEPRPRLRLTIHFEDAGDGWIVASVPEVPGAITQGRTRAEARANIIDALETLLTPDEQLAGQPPAPDDEPLTLTVS